MVLDILTVGLGFVLGFLVGMTGVGGGALTAPALYVILNLPYHQVVGISLVYASLTKLLSLLQHLRQGNVRWRLVVTYAAGGIPAAIVGSHLVHLFESLARRTLPLLMGFILMGVSALILFESVVRHRQQTKPFNPDRLTWLVRLAVVGYMTIVGCLVGLTSVGSGSLVILSLIYLFEMPVRQMVGTDITIAILMALPAGATHVLIGGVEFRTLFLLLAGAAAGAILGSKATMKVPDRVLKVSIGALIMLSAIATIIKASRA
ncbi:MAG: sulfite exporter TauE/SafE family protein [Candidatus Rokuibacteriota bacterium]